MMHTRSKTRRVIVEKARRMLFVLGRMGVIRSRIRCQTDIKFCAKPSRMYTRRYRMYQYLHPDMVYYVNMGHEFLMGGCLHPLSQWCKWCTVLPHEDIKDEIVFLKVRCRILCRIWNTDAYVNSGQSSQ